MLDLHSPSNDAGILVARGRLGNLQLWRNRSLMTLAENPVHALPTFLSKHAGLLPFEREDSDMSEHFRLASR